VTLSENAVDAQNRITETYVQGNEMIVDRKSILASALEAGNEAIAAERERLKKV
jgi:hypothetical protein